MELNLHTKAEGKYTFFNIDENQVLTYIGESDNLITEEGLEYIKTKKWVECFETIRIGDGGGPVVGSPSFESTALLNELDASNTVFANPGCGTYVTGSFDSTGSITYVFFRSWQLKNNNPPGTDWVIREVGAAPNAAGGVKGDVASGVKLFSHSYIPLTTQVSVSGQQSVVAMYELRLTTTSVFSGGNIKFYTGGNNSYQIPSINYYGVLGCPFACLKNDGSNTIVAKSATTNNLLFEPSNTDYYAGYIGKPAGTPGNTSSDLVEEFHAARKAFQTLVPAVGKPQGPLLADQNVVFGTSINPNAPIKYPLKPLGNNPHKFTLEPETEYVYKRGWRITTAPVPSQELNGLFVCTNISPIGVGAGLPSNTNITGNGWFLVFNDTWTRPNNTYLELAVNHTWS